MVENLSQLCETVSTVLFFCKKWGKTFDFFSQPADGRIDLTKGKTKTWDSKNKNVWRKRKMLNGFLNAIQYVVDMGASVMLPIVITIISVCIGIKIGKQCSRD